MIIISDTTPILSLIKAGRLELLEELYKIVIIPEAVYNELTRNNYYEAEKELIENLSNYLGVLIKKASIYRIEKEQAKQIIDQFPEYKIRT